uniref:Uncharacterized protein n=1 Tax=Anguilla anguilla TaxID=7936 RepID=A0A0E9WEW9_ANGAN
MGLGSMRQKLPKCYFFKQTRAGHGGLAAKASLIILQLNWLISLAYRNH